MDKEYKTILTIKEFDNKHSEFTFIINSNKFIYDNEYPFGKRVLKLKENTFYCPLTFCGFNGYLKKRRVERLIKILKHNINIYNKLREATKVLYDWTHIYKNIEKILTIHKDYFKDLSYRIDEVNSDELSIHIINSGSDDLVPEIQDLISEAITAIKEVIKK